MSAKIFALEEKIVIKSFVVPGMTAGSAALDISRTIARRAERRIVSLSHTEDVSRDLQKLINRLSDYLFVVARYLNKVLGREDVLWK